MPNDLLQLVRSMDAMYVYNDFCFCCGIASGYGQYTYIDLYKYYDSGRLKEIKSIYKNAV